MSRCVSSSVLEACADLLFLNSKIEELLSICGFKSLE